MANQYRGGARSMGRVRRQMVEQLGHLPTEVELYKKCYDKKDGMLPSKKAIDHEGSCSQHVPSHNASESDAMDEGYTRTKSKYINNCSNNLNNGSNDKMKN
ncbi:uncharacterized protein LOC127265817 [Andrographis paniculata]|uniref:uncharacterized protein LOC127265817 n=1 Tax=Andrographis paniculata TaxID=175694 RepID=UPI0021E83F9C|nr:uncharacterized protein LOC127265817 [Andrographis paniculata]